MRKKSLAFVGMLAATWFACEAIQASPWVQQDKWMAIGPIGNDGWCRGEIGTNYAAPHDAALECPAVGDDWSDIPRFVATTGPSARLSPSRHFASQLVPLRCFRGVSPRGEEPFPASTHGLVRVPSPLPRRAAFPHDRARESPAAFAIIVLARRSDSSSFVASTGRSLIVTARALAPRLRGFVGGLRPRDLPGGRHPSYAASISYRLEIFTLWIHGTSWLHTTMRSLNCVTLCSGESVPTEPRASAATASLSAS